MQADKYGSDFPVVCIFLKRHDTDTDGDVYTKQWGTDWGMPAYLCILEDDKDNSDGLEKVANVVCSKMNEYASSKETIAILFLTWEILLKTFQETKGIHWIIMF